MSTEWWQGPWEAHVVEHEVFKAPGGGESRYLRIDVMCLAKDRRPVHIGDAACFVPQGARLPNVGDKIMALRIPSRGVFELVEIP